VHTCGGGLPPIPVLIKQSRRGLLVRFLVGIASSRALPRTQAGFQGGRGAVLLKEVATRQLIAVLLTRVERFIESMCSRAPT